MNAPTLFDAQATPAAALDALPVVAPTPPAGPLRLKRSVVPVLNALRLRDEATAHDIAVELQAQQNCCSARLKDLCRLGLAETTHDVIGPRGKLLHVYRPTEKADLL